MKENLSESAKKSPEKPAKEQEGKVEIEERPKYFFTEDNWLEIGQYAYKKDKTGKWREKLADKKGIPGTYISKDKANKLNNAYGIDQIWQEHQEAETSKEETEEQIGKLKEQIKDEESEQEKVEKQKQELVDEVVEENKRQEVKKEVVARKEKTDLAESKQEAINKTKKNIQEATTFGEITSAIESVKNQEVILDKKTGEPYAERDLEKMVQIINQLKENSNRLEKEKMTKMINSLTRTMGIRDKVQELMTSPYREEEVKFKKSFWGKAMDKLKGLFGGKKEKAEEKAPKIGDISKEEIEKAEAQYEEKVSKTASPSSKATGMEERGEKHDKKMGESPRKF